MAEITYRHHDHLAFLAVCQGMSGGRRDIELCDDCDLCDDWRAALGRAGEKLQAICEEHDPGLERR
jgi:hypothetical protein